MGRPGAGVGSLFTLHPSVRGFMRRLLPRLAAVILVTGVVMAVATTALAVPVSWLGEAGSGEPEPIELGPLAQRSYVYAADGSLMAALKDEENRQPVALDQVPQHVIDAILAVEDLPLRHLLLEPLGEDDLLHLAVGRLLVADQIELHQLLGDRRAALADAAGVDVGLEGPHHAPDVVAVVDPEAGVLDGQDRVDDVLGHLVERDGLSVLLVPERRHQAAVGGVHVRALGERAQLDRLGLAGPGLAQPAHGNGQRSRGDGHDHTGDEDDRNEAREKSAHGVPGGG